jgi:hypothetical protein
LKLKVLGWILIATLGIAVLDHYELLGGKKIIEVQAHYMQYTCGRNNIDMRITRVSDSNFNYLKGVVISPELLNFNQKKLARLVDEKTAAFREGRAATLADFTLVGYVRKTKSEHCSGAICFKVEKIKYAGDSTFTEF